MKGKTASMLYMQPSALSCTGEGRQHQRQRDRSQGICRDLNNVFKWGMSRLHSAMGLEARLPAALSKHIL